MINPGEGWQEMKKLKEDFGKWAEENDIDLVDIWQKDGKWKKDGHFNNSH